jgi:hypothetical protein
MRTWYAIPFALLAVLGSLFVAVNTHVVEGSDEGDYVLAARYNPLLDYFDSPSHGWGYPAAIKLVAFVTGDEFSAAKTISVLASGVFIFWAALLCFRTLPPIYAVPVATAVALHPIVLRGGGNALCEMLFAALFFSALFLCFVCQPSLAACASGGVLMFMAMMVRGNAVVVLPLAPLLMLRCRDKKGVSNRREFGLAFLGAAVACLLFAGVLFAGMGVPGKLWLRSGAGELAFAALEHSGSFKNHFQWTDSPITYSDLLIHHGPDVAWRAINAIRNVNEWWLLPSFDVLGFFMIPGILIWLRKARPEDQGIAICSLAVLGTFIWSMHFNESRHLLQTVPVLLLGAFACFSILPRSFRILPTLRRIPLRTPVIWIVAILPLSFSMSFLASTARHGRHSTENDALYKAGQWIAAQQHSPGDRLATSRLSVAYYGRMRALDFRRIFEDKPIPKEEVAAILREHNCNWMVWVSGHTQIVRPELQWMEKEESFPGCDLVYRVSGVSVWMVRPTS